MIMQNKDSSHSHAAPMSEHAFAMLGAEDVAYIREVVVNGTRAWAIIGADGTSLAIAPDRELAFAAALQADKTPVSVH
jgi:hypothetical protein